MRYVVTLNKNKLCKAADRPAPVEGECTVRAVAARVAVVAVAVAAAAVAVAVAVVACSCRYCVAAVGNIGACASLKHKIYN